MPESPRSVVRIAALLALLLAAALPVAAEPAVPAHGLIVRLKNALPHVDDFVEGHSLWLPTLRR